MPMVPRRFRQDFQNFSKNPDAQQMSVSPSDPAVTTNSPEAPVKSGTPLSLEC